MDEKGDFDRLLETERRLEDRLRHARAEADALVVAARAAATQREAALTAELEAAERDLAALVAAERERQEAEIAAAARRTAAGFDGITGERLAAVVRTLGEWLLTGGRESRSS